MKSVPTWISYSHDFCQIFSCCLAIFAALESNFRFVLNQNSTDAWAPPIGDSVAGCHASIGHRRRHPPAARAGIKLPSRQLLSEASVAVSELPRCRHLQSQHRRVVRASPCPKPPPHGPRYLCQLLLLEAEQESLCAEMRGDHDHRCRSSTASPELTASSFPVIRSARSPLRRP
jgi:hypothetical protein